MTVGFVSSLCVGRRKEVELHMRETYDLYLTTTQMCSHSMCLRKGIELHMRETYDLDLTTTQMCSHSMCLLGAVHVAQHRRFIILWLLCVRKIRLRLFFLIMSS